MFRFRQPTPDAVASWLADIRDGPFTYPDVGATRDGRSPAGFNVDHLRTRIGTGELAFDRACDAIRRWVMFPQPWTHIQPTDAPIAVGQTVAVTARAFGLWWLNAARIVYVIDEAEPVRRFGFAYGTLPQHVESGEERFTVELHPDGGVWYDLLAFSRPRYWLTRLGYPFARRLQRRFREESAAAMKRCAT